MPLPPTLADWMVGSGPNHPLAAAGSRDTGGWEDIETLLKGLQDAQPHRLASKKREFRSLTNQERYGDLLSELRIAAWLAERGVRFEFGQPGQPQPDLVLPDFGFGIEVTRRKRTPDRDLSRAVHRGIRAAIPMRDRGSPRWRRARPTPLVRVGGFPITIRKTVLDAITDEVADAIRNGHREVHAVLRPARGNHPAVVANIDLYGGTSGMPRIVHDALWVDLTVPMLDIEDLVLAALQDTRKSLQGASMPSILLIDATRLSQLSWLRGPGSWADRLGVLLKPEHSFVGVGLAALVSPPRLGLGVGPRAEPPVRASIERWAGQMGMQSTTTEEPNPFGREAGRGR